MSVQIPVGYDPSVSGFGGVVGDIIPIAGGGGAWVRFGPNATDWRPFQGAGSLDMHSIVRATAQSILPAGFADYFCDYTGASDHATSFSLNVSSVAPVYTESGGKRRLTTQATGPGLAEFTPQVLIPVIINPKTSAWYAEGRAAIETHAANSLILPCCIALSTGGTMAGPPTSDTIVALGHAGTGFSGGSNSFLSLVAISAGVMALQTTTIPWTALMQAYGLGFDGAGTLNAFVNGQRQWSTTILTQIPVSGGFHANQWLYCTDNSPTTMLVDYMYAAGPRI